MSGRRTHARDPALSWARQNPETPQQMKSGDHVTDRRRLVQRNSLAQGTRPSRVTPAATSEWRRSAVAIITAI